MSKPVFYGTTTKYKNTVEMVDRLVSLYSTLKKEKSKQILPFEKEVFVFYILNGYSKDTKDFVKSEKKKNDGQMNTTNSNLRKKGFLVKDGRNMRKSKVNPELQEMVQSFIDNPSQIYAIQFKK